MVPGEQLFAGGLIVADIQFAEQGGTSQPTCAEVEAKIYERIELALGKRDLYQPGDGLLGILDVARKDCGGLRLGDAVGKRFVRLDQVAKADGRKPGDIEIYTIAKTLGLLDQIQTLSA